MAVRLRAFTCGYLTADRGRFLAGAPAGPLRVPIPAFLIEHPKGRVVFDAGMHPDIQTDPEARLGAIARVYVPEYGVGEDVGARLEAVDVDPERIEILVNSHLHFDHAGGNVCLPNARLVIQRGEWEAGQLPELRASNGFDPRDYDLGHDLLLVDGEHDLFGDGSVVCVPTFGHTPGHQSLRVRLDSGDVLLCADCCYMRQSLTDLHLPPVVHDPAQALATLRELAALEASGTRLFFGHDPELWQGVPQAPDLIR